MQRNLLQMLDLQGIAQHVILIPTSKLKWQEVNSQIVVAATSTADEK